MDKNVMRDALTNKRIGNKEVICVDNAIDYVKKMGYLVIRPMQINQTIFQITWVLCAFFSVSLFSLIKYKEVLSI